MIKQFNIHTPLKLKYVGIKTNTNFDQRKHKCVEEQTVKTSAHCIAKLLESYNVKALLLPVKTDN